MSIFSRLPRPQAMSNYELSKTVREYFDGGFTETGIAVNSDTAMRLMTVHNCVKVLYNCISQMPCQLMQDTGGIKEKAKDHSLYRVIGKRPNRWMTAPEFWGMAIVHVAMRGNFYAFKSMYGPTVKELLPIAPDRVQEVIQEPDYSLTYKIYNPNGEVKPYSQEKILHIRGFSLDGIVGINPIQYARECIGLGLAGEKFLGRYFGKGLHPGMVIEHPLALSSSGKKNLSEVLQEQAGGIGRSHNLMFLDEGMSITFPPIKLVDAQFLELMKMTEAQIAGMFGVPLMLIQAGGDPTTYASATEFKRTFVDMVIAPIAVNFESSADRDCLTEKDQETFYTKFNLNALLRGNIAERFAAYAIGIEEEILNPNECRALEDLNPYEGGEVYKNRKTAKAADAAVPAKGE